MNRYTAIHRYSVHVGKFWTRAVLQEAVLIQLNDCFISGISLIYTNKRSYSTSIAFKFQIFNLCFISNEVDHSAPECRFTAPIAERVPHFDENSQIFPYAVRIAIQIHAKCLRRIENSEQCNELQLKNWLNTWLCRMMIKTLAIFHSISRH